ncbi:UDP-glycosyltransferase 84B2 [Ziziphus jujuba]|uniref:UDP-glycosyltransferase 84B2 n=2 Tax=Ziziphus jujuba TaxID=326968 RepID=A0A6P4A7I5_ZIZJJ|nr:UDP-glycosyltransferase 84B2 [Ziziphus jujuba]KAH7520248.1 hypothetical protein FEM48_Zijuj08G0124000 [Ziziphus jujuba var. spinosa]
MPTDINYNHVEGVHVLLGTVAMQGHMNPVLKLAKFLASKGVHVTVATTDVARHRLLKQNNSGIVAASGNTKIQLEFYSDGLSLEFDRNGNVGAFVDSLHTTGYENLSNLIDSINKDRKISCLVFNPFMPWMADVAADHGIPCAALWIQASASYSIYYRYFDNPTLFGNLENPTGQVIELPGLPILEVKDLPTLMLPSCPAPIKSQLFQFYQNMNKVNWVLGTSFYELEEEIVDSMSTLFPIHPIGPLVSPFLLGKEEEETADSLKIDLFKVEDSCIDWLDKQQPSSVIYIAFGSLIVLTQDHIDNIANALKNINRPFLWVMKPPEKGSKSKIGELPYGFVDETKEKGVVVEWCAQEKVLMHKSLACFMTHVGWNSTLETVVCGVPVVAYPQWTDQPTNARLIEDVFKVGVSVRQGEDGVASGEEVEKCIMEVIEGPKAEEIKKRALELKEAAKKAVQNGGSSDKNIDQFIREISAKRV